MKTSKLFFLGIFGLASLFVNAQVVNQSNASATSVGFNAGTSTSSTAANTFYGSYAGNTGSTTGSKNTLIGANAGKYAYASSAVCIGNNAGGGTPGLMGNSVLIGDGAGFTAGTVAGGTGGNGTVAIGQNSGNDRMGGNNVFVGINAGKFSNGSGNIFLGASAGGTTVVESNKLFIDNSSTTTPLIWGDFTNDQVKLNGKVGIGFGTLTTFPTTAGSINVSGYNLFVGGGILTEEIRVNLRNGSSLWADYVFNKDYALKSLPEVEKFIAENGHLPNVPSAKEVKENGIELGEMAKIQQEKIEELTLYLIEQNKAIEALKAQVRILSERK